MYVVCCMYKDATSWFKREECLEDILIVSGGKFDEILSVRFIINVASAAPVFLASLGCPRRFS